MIERKLLGTGNIPGGGGELKLWSRALKGGDEFSIMLGGTELMNSRKSGSEEALATLACEQILSGANPRLLIGGLGMGFTLRAALPLLPDDAVIVVAELVPAVVDWARGPMAELYGGSLEDPRVNIRLEDVAASINVADAGYDAILLDVDNGPDGLTHTGNEAIYSHAGLKAARRALRTNGVLAVWSSAPDPGFTRRLKECGFAVREAKARAHGKRGGHHVIWLATK
ncbi:Spermine/spermidine synthase [Parasphingorhabdus marina DSM 22363]|uniref:Spermine/spermidine synthase n=1 Tax=Parasphingorhabdus marina DSM 22363 TaxID=1123272 RepID=A0A1N6EUQ2_9SPHN|nr:hypothetical protein [Parasphingorhabdus marina]SIN86694.1 Spermine/spermidine synthase [Parasphingorhabdus marina DSM 22363]